MVGSLSWYSRVCRPDLAFQVNVPAPSHPTGGSCRRPDGREPPPEFCPGDPRPRSYDATNEGHIAGHRLQSGYLLALNSKKFLETGEGKVHLLQWSSTVIKRVCRSTLQAETLSLLYSSEDAEHMRQLLYVVKNKATALKRTEKFINAMDATIISWYTDCRSLSDHLTNVNAAAVSDKRLAIDLTSLRQELCRERAGNLVGNPSYSDELPSNRTTLCLWVATKTMPADSLTKGMESPQMDELMKTGCLQMTMQQQHSGQKESYGWNCYATVRS